MVDNLLKSQAFKLKGRLYTFTVLQLLSGDLDAFVQQLKEAIRKAPRFFNNTPVVLDCSSLLSLEVNLQAICQSMREHQLCPIAVQGANAFLATLAHSQGLAVLNLSSASEKVPEEKGEASSFIPLHSKTKLHNSPVRSGQQLSNQEGDLIITAAVSHGAELLAQGHIHVYGALRGRALAGITGNREARIFCQSLEAELLSIAGFYRLSDAMEPCATPCQIYLQNEHIVIEPLC